MQRGDRPLGPEDHGEAVGDEHHRPAPPQCGGVTVGIDRDGLLAASRSSIGVRSHAPHHGPVDLAAGAQPPQPELLAETVAFAAAVLVTEAARG